MDLSEHNSGRSSEPIAIVGIGCRFPGGVDSPASFWDLLRDGVDAIEEFPEERTSIDARFTAAREVAGKAVTRQGGYLHDIDHFDASFFGISPREVMQLDPQQRLLLETAWEALEDAGIPQSRISGSSTGVYVGVWLNDFEASIYNALNEIELHTTTGSGRYPGAGRISFALDLRGPSLTVDTACSSSLVAVHLAVQGLRTGQTNLALAAGVNVILQPHITQAYTRSGMLAADGRCKFGDAAADGYVRSEGCGVVVLKRLGDALADSDPIYAVIRGSAVNNDGQGSGLLVKPSTEGQIAMLREAYADAGVEPARVGYIEAHGTGTLAGDPVEIQAIGSVLGAERPVNEPCLIGSVKANIGHTEGAAGIAGVIKTALALRHGAIPGNIHFKTPNPDIPWNDIPVKVPATLTPWPPSGTPRFAGVSSFGITGTNAHIVLEGAPQAGELSRSSDQTAGPVLLPISAKSPDALRDYADRLAGHVGAESPSLIDIGYTLANRRSHLEERLALVASPDSDLVGTLRDMAGGTTTPETLTGRAGSGDVRVAFVFPGQGSQWYGMARELLAEEPVFRASIEQSDAAIRAETGWSVVEMLVDAPDDSRLEEIDVVQPLLFAVQLALAALWRSRGIEPAAVIGHSMGEIAAAHVAGSLSLEDAAAVICRRSRLLRSIAGQGAMALVDLSVDETQVALSGYEDMLSIAVSNSPRSTVISGDPQALDTVLQRLQADDIFCRPIKVDVASHSPQVEPLLDDLRDELAQLQPGISSLPLYSTVRVTPVDGRVLDASYWADNLRHPVLFGDSLQRVCADGVTTFIEISPHPILLPAIQQGLQVAGSDGAALPSLRRNEPERATMLASLGELFVRGAPVNWSALYPSGKHLHLPSYRWQKERFWFDENGASPGRVPARTGGHAVLGHRFTVAGRDGLTTWDLALDARSQPFLQDHQVGGAVIASATTLTETLLAAASEALATDSLVVGKLDIHAAAVLPQDAEVPMQIVVQRKEQQAEISIFSSSIDADGETTWTLHASGSVGVLVADPAASAETADRMKLHCTRLVSGDEHYDAMAARGLEYGPAFRSVSQSWHGEDEVFGVLQLDTTDGVSGHEARIRLLDGGLQLAVATIPEHLPGAYVPVQMAGMRIHGPLAPDEPLYAHAVRQVALNEGPASFSFEIRFSTADGRLVADIDGLQLRSVERSDLVALDGWLHEVAWQPQPRPKISEGDVGDWLVVGEGATVIDLAAIIEAQGGQATIISPDADTDSGTAHDDRDGQLAELIAAAHPGGEPPHGIVYAPALDSEVDSDIAAAAGWDAVLLLRAIAGTGWASTPPLWLITRNAQPAGGEPVSARQAPLWGIGRVIADEHPEFACRLVDLGAAGRGADLYTELLTATDETQIALRGADRYVARLEPRSIDAEAPEPSRRPAEPDEPYRLEVLQPGILDTIGARAASRRSPDVGEIEIHVEAAGINFIDVMKAMGICPGFEPRPDIALGGECAGVITRIGPDVVDLAVGDKVIAFTPSFHEVSCLASYVTLPAALAMRRPASLSPEQAAGQALVYMTAHYALHELGRMQPSERVLIHAAAGGVGLAAIELAQRAGAKVFATAGSDEKREYVRAIGVEHVYDSRSLAFADEVLRDTDGRGVDLVLNSLSGDAIAASLRALAPRGRFIEIGKRDIYADSPIGLAPFRKNLSFFALDLARMVEEDRDDVAALFRNVVQLLDRGEIAPLPVTVFDAAHASDAFREMAQARHIGKLVVRLGAEPVDVLSGGPLVVRADASYLITGGLGALGLETAGWLARRGARALALLGRSEPTADAREAISRLEAAGVTVLPLQCDVTDTRDVERALESIDDALPPLRGIFNAAGLLADGTLMQVDREHFANAIGPKVAGAWNLHHQTLNRPLDCFVLFSSVASLLGLPGQANYAAANAFLDGLAHQRRAAGLPALSVNWAPWSGIGLAAVESQRGQRLHTQGLAGLEPQRGIAALDRLLEQDATQAAVMNMDLTTWRDSHPAAQAPFFASLEQDDASGESSRFGLRESVLEAAPDRRLAILEDFVRDQLSYVLRIAPERLSAATPLKSLGLDSLMALELRNRLESGAGLTLSATLVWNYPTIAALAEHLAARLEVPSTVASDAPPVAAQSADVTDDLLDLSQDEVATMLQDELDSIAKLLGTD